MKFTEYIELGFRNDITKKQLHMLFK